MVRLNAAKSKLLIPCARNDESTRDSSPKPHCGGAAKQDVLNHCVSVRGPVLSHPATTSGRTLLTPKLAFSKEVAAPPHEILSGKPRWNVVTPSIPQPDTSLSPAPDIPARNLFPCPKGRSST